MLSENLFHQNYLLQDTQVNVIRVPKVGQFINKLIRQHIQYELALGRMLLISHTILHLRHIQYIVYVYQGYVIAVYYVLSFVTKWRNVMN
jgi:hypothetical protein